MPSVKVMVEPGSPVPCKVGVKSLFGEGAVNAGASGACTSSVACPVPVLVLPAASVAVALTVNTPSTKPLPDKSTPLNVNCPVAESIVACVASTVTVVVPSVTSTVVNSPEPSVRSMVPLMVTDFSSSLSMLWFGLVDVPVVPSIKSTVV